MSFASIAFKNVRKKFGSYLVYFVSIVFAVIVFNLFCSLYYNPSFETYRFGAGKMTTLFRGSAVAVLLFVAVFVLYSGSYFVKGQKKEIATYSLLGMRKNRIALMMFFETFFIGILAVAIGTLAGTFSAGNLTALLMRFMAVGTSVTLSVDPRAILATALAFAALFAISGIRAYAIIYRYTLIELLSASQKSEDVPSYSPWGAAASLLLLAAGYGLSTTVTMYDFGLQLLLPALGTMVLVTCGTFLLFRNLVPITIAFFKKNKTLYYKTSNFISASQIAFRLKANSGVLAAVAILCAATVTMVSASYSLYNGLADGTDYYAPYSYMAKNITNEQHDEMLAAVEAVGEVQLLADDTVELICADARSEGYGLEARGDEMPAFGQDCAVYIMAEGTYRQIVKSTAATAGENTNLATSFGGSLANDECFFLDGNTTARYSEELPGQNLYVDFLDTSTSYTVTGISLHKYIGLIDLYRHPTVVVSEAVYESYREQAGSECIETFTGLMFNDEMISGPTVDALDAIIPARFESGGLPPNISYIGIYKANFALYGTYVFVGLFIGVLFLVATGSILYYKMIMEAQEEAPRYGILRKSGLKLSEARASIAKQLGLVFGLPFAIGLAHTVCALFVYNRMLDLMGQETPTLQNATFVVCAFVIVYGAFYALSVSSYRRIVWVKER